MQTLREYIDKKYKGSVLSCVSSSRLNAKRAMVFNYLKQGAIVKRGTVHVLASEKYSVIDGKIYKRVGKI